MSNSMLAPIALRPLGRSFLRLATAVTPTANTKMTGAWSAADGFANTIAQVGSTPEFVLKANCLYVLEAHLYVTGLGDNGVCNVDWRTSAGASFPATACGGTNRVAAAASATREERPAIIKAFAKFGVDTNVALWCLSWSGTIAVHSASRSTSIHVYELPTMVYAP